MKKEVISSDLFILVLLKGNYHQIIITPEQEKKIKLILGEKIEVTKEPVIKVMI